MPLNSSELQELYWSKGLSIKNISNIYNSYPSAIHKAMVISGIPRRTLSKAISKARVGRLNPMWVGENIKPESARCRARRTYRIKFCRICGGKAEIHHKDGNPLNNEPDNIDFLCRKHHMELDGRIKRRRNGRFVRG